MAVPDRHDTQQEISIKRINIFGPPGSRLLNSLGEPFCDALAFAVISNTLKESSIEIYEPLFRTRSVASRCLTGDFIHHRR